MAVGLGTVDLILLVCSMLLTALIGLYFTNKNKSLDSYMLGDRKLSVLPVAISLMTSCLSGLSLLGSSAEFYYQGPTYAFVIIPMLLCGPITAFTILPIFYRMNELSLYKYLHIRYGLVVKYIVTIVFILQMIFYNSVVLYLPSMALSAILGISRFYSILIIGLMCVVYSGIGGLKAVVWTDLLQAIFMYAAVITVAILGTYDAGGLSEVVKLSKDNGRLELDDFFSFDLTTRHTFWGILFGSTVKHVYLVGVNQVQIQRALSLPTLRQGQYSFIFCSCFAALMIALSSYLGAVLVAAYRSCDPFLNHEIPRRDAIIVHYVARRLALIPGLRGLFVAGIFSATLSTLSSFSNSMAALALQDFINPIWDKLSRKQMSPKTGTYIAKVLTSLFGVVCVLMAYLIEKANSRLLQATTTMFGAIGVPFLASFAMGIFTRFANTLGILAGFAVTLTLGIYITIYQTFFLNPLEPHMPIFYSEKCVEVFNMSLPADQMPDIRKETEWSLESDNLPEAKIPFRISQISYMTLPVIQFILMIVISTIVSLLTGGQKQHIDDQYLMPMARNKTKKTLIIGSQYEGKTFDDGKHLNSLDRFDSSIVLESKLVDKINGQNNKLNHTYTNKAFQHNNGEQELVKDP